MFPAPIAFLNYELKAELGMKSKKEEEEDDAKFCALKVPMDNQPLHCQVQEIWFRNSIRLFEIAFDFEWADEKPWIQRRLWHGHEFSPLNVGGTQFRSIFEWTAGQKRKKQKCKGKEQAAYNPQQTYGCEKFESAIRAFDIQS
jgi:hypothetical protein